MFKSVLGKTLYEKRWSTLFWVIGLAAAAALTMAFYPSFSQKGIDQIIGSVPDSLKSLIGSAASFKTVPGYLAQQIYGPNLLIVIIAMSVIVFISLTTNDEERGTLQTLLTLPVSRQRVLVSKLAAGLIMVGLGCAAMTVGALIGLAAIHEAAPLGHMLVATLACWLLCCCYGLVAFALAMATGWRGLTIGVASAYAFASFLVTSLAPAAAKLKPIDAFSLLHYYNAHPVLLEGVHWGSLGVLAAVAAVLIGVCLPLFMRRDIG